MNKNSLPDKMKDEKEVGWLLKQEMEENALKMKLLSEDQAGKIAELAKVKQEIEQLNRLYGGKKRKG